MVANYCVYRNRYFNIAIRQMKQLKFYPKFALGVFMCFVLLTIVGTQLHELGHVTVAKYFGYETELYHGSMIWSYEGEKNDPDYIKYQKILDTYSNSNPEEIEHIDESIKAEAEALMIKIEAKFPYNKTHHFWISFGGPFQTILTSFIGLCILYYRKSKFKTVFKVLDWLGVFLGLFILREVYNTVSALFVCGVYSTCYFPGDEFTISQLFGLNLWVVPIITMIFGGLIACYIIFKVIPKQYQLTFIIAGVIGGLSGYWLWFGGFGKFCFSLFN